MLHCPTQNPPMAFHLTQNKFKTSFWTPRLRFVSSLSFPSCLISPYLFCFNATACLDCQLRKYNNIVLCPRASVLAITCLQFCSSKFPHGSCPYVIQMSPLLRECSWTPCLNWNSLLLSSYPTFPSPQVTYFIY